MYNRKLWISCTLAQPPAAARRRSPPPLLSRASFLQDVEGVGAAGQVVRVAHGYARNHLVPSQQGVLLPLPRRRRGRGRDAAAADAAAASVQQQQQRQAAANPAAQSLEKQQRDFDKLMKTLTGSTLVRRRPGGGQAQHEHRELNR